MQELAILYSFRRCPYAMRARFSLVQAGIKCELREVNLRDKPAELIELSPKATVPVLQLSNGKVIDESMDIIKHALNIDIISPEDKSLIAKNDGEFADILRRYKYQERYPEKSREEYREDAEIKFFNNFEAILTENDYLNGAEIGISDIAIFPFIRQFAGVDEEYFYNSKYKNLQNWLDKILSSPEFEKTMQKEDHWKSGDTAIIFPS